MLATWGFIVAGLLFGIFAYTFHDYVIERTGLKLNQFPFAYYCLALALLIWSAASANGSFTWLKDSVIIGDCLLLAGSLFMLDILLGPTRRFWLAAAAAAAAGLVAYRINHYPPVPYLHDGVLIFNSQRPVAIVLGLVIVLIWLPANLKVARVVTEKIGQKSIRTTYSYLYMTTTAAALVFISARRVATVVLSFAAVLICVALLIASNWLVKDIGVKRARSK